MSNTFNVTVDPEEEAEVEKPEKVDEQVESIKLAGNGEKIVETGEVEKKETLERLDAQALLKFTGNPVEPVEGSVVISSIATDDQKTGEKTVNGPEVMKSTDHAGEKEKSLQVVNSKKNKTDGHLDEQSLSNSTETLLKAVENAEEINSIATNGQNPGEKTDDGNQKEKKDVDKSEDDGKKEMAEHVANDLNGTDTKKELANVEAEELKKTAGIVTTGIMTELTEKTEDGPKAVEIVVKDSEMTDLKANEVEYRVDSEDLGMKENEGSPAAKKTKVMENVGEVAARAAEVPDAE